MLQHASTKLSVNLNKIAWLRNARKLDIPNVLRFAEIAISAGASGLTVHPRPDGRHIKSDDLPGLSDFRKHRKGVELNIEGNPFQGLMPLIRRVIPDQCTLVPDAEDALTSNEGWKLDKNAEQLIPVIDELKSLGVRVSLFIDPEPKIIKLSKQKVELAGMKYEKTWKIMEKVVNFGKIW